MISRVPFFKLSSVYSSQDTCIVLGSNKLPGVIHHCPKYLPG